MEESAGHTANPYSRIPSRFSSSRPCRRSRRGRAYRISACKKSKPLSTPRLPAPPLPLPASPAGNLRRLLLPRGRRRKGSAAPTTAVPPLQEASAPGPRKPTQSRQDAAADRETAAAPRSPPGTRASSPGWNPRRRCSSVPGGGRARSGAPGPRTRRASFLPDRGTHTTRREMIQETMAAPGTVGRRHTAPRRQEVALKGRVPAASTVRPRPGLLRGRSQRAASRPEPPPPRSGSTRHSGGSRGRSLQARELRSPRGQSGLPSGRRKVTAARL